MRCGGDKEELLKQLCLVLDAPSELLYKEREEKLLETTAELTVKPGQEAKSVNFAKYYEKNWKGRFIFLKDLFSSEMSFKFSSTGEKSSELLSNLKNLS